MDRSPAEDIDLDALLRTFWRRRVLLVVPALIAVVLALLAVFQIPPRYTATTLLMLDTRGARVVDLEQVVPGLGADTAVVRSEVEVLRSRAVAEAVVDAEALATDPEFNPALAESLMPSSLMVWLGARTLTPAEARMRTIDAFREALQVSLVDRSLVIAVAVSSRDPEKAARLSAATAGAYLTRQLDLKFEATRKATLWLGSKLETLRAGVTAAEAAVAAYRADHALGQDGDASLAATERGDLTAALVQARADRAEAEARLSRLKAARAAGDLESAPAVVASPLIQHLGEQEAEVRRRIADLSARYGERHPRMREALAQLDGLRRQVAAEAGKIAAAVDAEARTARAREQALADGLAQLERRRVVEGEAAVRLADLEREAEASRVLYESFLTRMKETTGQQGLETPDARIVSAAAVPVRPSGPRRSLIVGAAGLLGLMLGIVLVYAAERLDRGLRGADDVEDRLGLPLLAAVPATAKGADEDTAAEEMRSLRTALMLTRATPPRVICVTSSLPGEGKTTLALSLARTAAGGGTRVALVDCDLRRPKVARLLGLAERPGLVDVLAGDVPLDDALHHVDGALSVLPGRVLGGAAPDLLAGPAMRGLLDALRKTVDLVVLDTPPLLPVADARVLAPLADATVFAVRWEKTPHDVAAEGLRHLERAAVQPVGAVLTQVDLRRQRSYGYGGAYRYYGAYHAVD